MVSGAVTSGPAMLITSRSSSQSSVSTLSCASSGAEPRQSAAAAVDKIKVLVLGAPGVGKSGGLSYHGTV